jgi:hypothetical protein
VWCSEVRTVNNVDWKASKKAWSVDLDTAGGKSVTVLLELTMLQKSM